ncbi:CK001 protein, partial [Polypterus senegalus]|nr:CK001 protein [Polypterus senegalus]
MKFKQYGWRSGTSEDAYTNQTLIGNWNEERFSVSSATRSRPLPTQFAHYFTTTHTSDYGTHASAVTSSTGEFDTLGFICGASGHRDSGALCGCLLIGPFIYLFTL